MSTKDEWTQRKQELHASCFEEIVERYNVSHQRHRVSTIEEVYQWLSKRSSKLFIFYAGCGMGKSSLAAFLTDKFRHESSLLSSTFFTISDNELNSGRMFIMNMAVQIAENLPELKEHVLQAFTKISRIDQLNLSKLVNKVILKPLSHITTNRGNKKGASVCIIDGIDNIEDEDARREILELICDLLDQLPTWVKIFFTSKMDGRIAESFADYDPYIISATDSRHIRDLTQYITHQVANNIFYGSLESHPEILPKYVKVINEKCQGNWLCATFLLQLIQQLEEESPIGRQLSEMIIEESTVMDVPEPTSIQDEQVETETPATKENPPPSPSIDTSTQAEFKRKKRLWDERFDKLPNGLNEYYRLHFKHIRTKKLSKIAFHKAHELISLCICAREPIRYEDMKYLLQYDSTSASDEEEMQKICQAIQPVIFLSSRYWNKQQDSATSTNTTMKKVFRIFHKSLLEWFHDLSKSQEYFVDDFQANELLCQRLFTCIGIPYASLVYHTMHGNNAQSTYLLRYHLQSLLPTLIRKKQKQEPSGPTTSNTVMTTTTTATTPCVEYFFENILYHLDSIHQELWTVCFLTSLHWIFAVIQYHGLYTLTNTVLKRYRSKTWMQAAAYSAAEITNMKIQLRVLYQFLVLIASCHFEQMTLCTTEADIYRELCAQMIARLPFNGLLQQQDPSAMTGTDESPMFGSEIEYLVYEAKEWIARYGGYNPSYGILEAPNENGFLLANFTSPHKIITIRRFPLTRQSQQPQSRNPFLDGENISTPLTPSSNSSNAASTAATNCSNILIQYPSECILQDPITGEIIDRLDFVQDELEVEVKEVEEEEESEVADGEEEDGEREEEGGQRKGETRNSNNDTARNSIAYSTISSPSQHHHSQHVPILSKETKKNSNSKKPKRTRKKEVFVTCMEVLSTDRIAIGTDGMIVEVWNFTTKEKEQILELLPTTTDEDNSVSSLGHVYYQGKVLDMKLCDRTTTSSFSYHPILASTSTNTVHPSTPGANPNTGRISSSVVVVVPPQGTEYLAVSYVHGGKFKKRFVHIWDVGLAQILYTVQEPHLHSYGFLQQGKTFLVFSGFFDVSLHDLTVQGAGNGSGNGNDRKAETSSSITLKYGFHAWCKVSDTKVLIVSSYQYMYILEAGMHTITMTVTPVRIQGLSHRTDLSGLALKCIRVESLSPTWVETTTGMMSTPKTRKSAPSSHNHNNNHNNNTYAAVMYEINAVTRTVKGYYLMIYDMSTRTCIAEWEIPTTTSSSSSSNSSHSSSSTKKNTNPIVLYPSVSNTLLFLQDGILLSKWYKEDVMYIWGVQDILQSSSTSMMPLHRSGSLGMGGKKFLSPPPPPVSSVAVRESITSRGSILSTTGVGGGLPTVALSTVVPELSQPVTTTATLVGKFFVPHVDCLTTIPATTTTTTTSTTTATITTAHDFLIGSLLPDSPNLGRLVRWTQATNTYTTLWDTQRPIAQLIPFPSSSSSSNNSHSSSSNSSNSNISSSSSSKQQQHQVIIRFTDYVSLTFKTSCLIYDYHRRRVVYQFFHHTKITAVAVSQGGRIILGMENGFIFFWSTAIHKQLYHSYCNQSLPVVLRGHSRCVSQIIVTKYHGNILSFGHDNTVRLWQKSLQYQCISCWKIGNYLEYLDPHPMYCVYTSGTENQQHQQHEERVLLQTKDKQVFLWNPYYFQEEEEEKEGGGEDGGVSLTAASSSRTPENKEEEKEDENKNESQEPTSEEQSRSDEPSGKVIKKKKSSSKNKKTKNGKKVELNAGKVYICAEDDYELFAIYDDSTLYFLSSTRTSVYSLSFCPHQHHVPADSSHSWKTTKHTTTTTASSFLTGAVCQRYAITSMYDFFVANRSIFFTQRIQMIAPCVQWLPFYCDHPEKIVSCHLDVGTTGLPRMYLFYCDRMLVIDLTISASSKVTNEKSAWEVLEESFFTEYNMN